MKRKALPFLCLIVLSAITTKAQVQKGDVLLGATLSYSNAGGSSNVSPSSSTDLSPRIGLAIGHNSVLGLKANFGYQKTSGPEGSNDPESTSYSLGTTLFWKKFVPIKNQFGWYIETNGGVAFGKTKGKTALQEYKNSTTSYVAGVYPGVYYQPSPRVLLSADAGGLNYIYYAVKNGGNPSWHTSVINLSLLNAFTFSVDILLTKAKG